MAEPIFVIGRNRSGTKWLSNILANHKDIAAVQREGAGGILESNILSQYPKYFHLSKMEERTAFEVLFKNSNFHLCSGIEGKFIKSGNYDSYYDFFVKYMNEVAVKRNAGFWLQKTSSDKLTNITQQFPNAKILIIQRKNVLDNVISTLLASNGTISFVRMTMVLNGYWRYNKIENKYKNKLNVYTLTYEDLKSDSEKTIKPVCDFLGIPFHEDILNRKYEPNTSYKKIDKEQFYTKSNIFKIKVISKLFKYMPLFMLEFFNNTKNFLRRNKQEMFMAKTFEEYRRNESKSKS